MLAVTLWAVFNNGDLADLKVVLSNAESNFIGLGVLALIMYVFLEALMIHIMINSRGKPQSLWISIKTTLIGQYYSLITPFASGGQPMQLYSMMKDGISASFGTAVLVNKFLVFQIGITVYSFVLIVLRYRSLLTAIQDSAGFVFIGLTINTLGLSMLVLLVFKPSILKKTVVWGFELVHRLNLIRKTKERIQKMHHKIDEYTESIRYMIQHKTLLTQVAVLTLIQLTAYFSITFFIYRALGLESRTFIDIIAIQAILYMSVSFIPSPGTAGAAEGGFLILFGSLFTSNYLSYAVLLWRGISYYLNLVLSGLFTLGLSMTQSIKKQHFGGYDA